MNTSNQHESLKQRLDKLAEFDSESAGLIRHALSLTSVWPAVTPSSEWLADLDQWLADQKHADLVILLGAGPAGEMRILTERLPADSRLMLIEQDPRQAAALFHNWPMEELAVQKRLILALGDDSRAIENKVAKVFDINNPPAVAIYDKNQLAPEAANFYYQILKNVRQGIKLDTFNINTLLRHGPVWQFNSLKNLPLLFTNPGISTLFSTFQRRPALIIGAGPSLNDALPYIKRNAGKFVVLAAATALRPLREAGIRPDMVAAVDASRKTGMQFTARCDDLFLACSSMAYPPALRKFRGLFNGHLGASPIDKWMQVIGQPKGEWIAAGTVTTSALDLAIKMGCDPIISLGFDLSFTPNGITHANQTMYHGMRLDPQRLAQTPGNYTETVPTTEQFKVYIDLLTDFLKNNTGPRFINATTGGAHLEGMELQKPAVLDDFPESDTIAYSDICSIHAAFVQPDMADITGRLNQAVDQFAAVITDTHKAARICNRLIMMLKSPCANDIDVARQYLSQLKQIDQAFAGLRDSSLLLDMGLWPASFATHATATDQQNNNDAIQTNRKSREIYEQIAGAAQWSRELITEAIKTMEQTKTVNKEETQ